MHHLLHAEDIRLVPAYVGNSKSFSRCSLVDGTSGSVHMGLGLCALKAGGMVDTHLHSFEESFYILEGQPTLVLDGGAYPLVSGACGLVPARSRTNASACGALRCRYWAPPLVRL